MSNFFEQDEESEYMTEERAEQVLKESAAEKHAHSKKKANKVLTIKEEDEEFDEEFEIFADEDLENDEELMNDVSLRLEQGRLYQMILNQDLFQNIDAPPKAIANVQREIRAHVKSRLAVLLGITPEVRTQTVRHESQFTDMEVDLLRAMAFKFSGGATKKNKEPIEREQVLAPVVSQRPQSLSPVAGPKPAQRIAVPKKENRPVKAPAASGGHIKTKHEQIKDLEAELEGTAKPAHLMSSSEREARNIKISQLERLKKPPAGPNAIPQPSQEQANMAYTMMAGDTVRSLSNTAFGKVFGK